MSEPTPQATEWSPPVIKAERVEVRVDEHGHRHVSVYMPTLAVQQAVNGYSEFKETKEKEDG